MLPFEKILVLNRISLFENLRTDALQIISVIAEEEDFEAGETLFLEGEYGEKLYVLVRGQVDLLSKRGQQIKKLLTLSDGEILGEMALFGEGTRSATAICYSNCSFLSIDKKEFSELIYQYPDISLGIITQLSKRLREANQFLFKMKSELFGNIGLRKGFFTDKDILKALTLQREEITEGKERRRIGDILIDLGLLQEDQRKEIVWEIDNPFEGSKNPK